MQQITAHENAAKQNTQKSSKAQHAKMQQSTARENAVKHSTRK
jgi:hypothetical protein